MDPAWALDPEVRHLNHGSFGACPRPVLEAQTRIRAEAERNPMAFYARGLEARLDAAREPLARFLGACPEDLAFVPNASYGASCVLRSLRFEPGDEVLVTHHGYNGVRTALDYVLGRAGARRVVAEVPFPLERPEQVVEAVLACVGPRTRLAVLDWVTSPTALVLPVNDLVAALEERGVDVLIDGAHAPGMVEVDLDRLGAAYFTGNAHKWLCAPKGAAVLHVRRDRQEGIVPLVVSHGYDASLAGRSRFQRLFDWQGTDDPSAFLALPAALDFLGSLLPGGWKELRARNHALAVEAREILCAALGCTPPAPPSLLGSMAAVPLPRHPLLPERPGRRTPLQEALSAQGFEVAVVPFPAAPDYLLRVSAQAYNRREDYEALAAALKELLS